MHPGRPYRPAGRTSAARPPAAGTGSPGCLRSTPLPGFGCGEVFQPVCHDASARAVTRSSGTCALSRAAIDYSWYRRPICIITGPPPSAGDDITRLLQMSTAGSGRTGPNGLTCRRSSRQVSPNLRRRMAARPHADRPDVHAADGRFSTPRGGHGDVWALSARDLRRDSVVCDTGYARATGSRSAASPHRHRPARAVVTRRDLRLWASRP